MSTPLSAYLSAPQVPGRRGRLPGQARGRSARPSEAQLYGTAREKLPPGLSKDAQGSEREPAQRAFTHQPGGAVRPGPDEPRFHGRGRASPSPRKPAAARAAPADRLNQSPRGVAFTHWAPVAAPDGPVDVFDWWREHLSRPRHYALGTGSVAALSSQQSGRRGGQWEVGWGCAGFGLALSRPAASPPFSPYG